MAPGATMQLLASSSLAAPPFDRSADHRDAAVFDRHIGAVPGYTRPVDNGTPTNDYVVKVHNCSPTVSSTSSFIPHFPAYCN